MAKQDRLDPYRGWTKEYPVYVLREGIASAVRGAPDAWFQAALGGTAFGLDPPPVIDPLSVAAYDRTLATTGLHSNERRFVLESVMPVVGDAQMAAWERALEDLVGRLSAQERPGLGSLARVHELRGALRQLAAMRAAGFGHGQ